MVSKLRTLLDKQEELQVEAEALQHRIDREVQGNIFDYLNKATKKHGKEFVASVLTGYQNGEELEAVAEELERADIIAHTAIGEPLRAAAAHLARAALFLGGDSGIAHLAVAIGTPTVVLYGASDDMKWGHTHASGRHRVNTHPPLKEHPLDGARV